MPVYKFQCAKRWQLVKGRTLERDDIQQNGEFSMQNSQV